MSKDILITGIRGFVGSNLLQYLLNHESYSIAGSSRKKSSLRPIRAKVSQITSHKDIIENNLKFQFYIHLSGKVFDLNDKSAEQEYYEVNYELTKQLFDHFIQDKSARKFIFVSTIHVLTENPDRVVDENYEPRPFTPYGKSKYLAEKYIAENCPPDKNYYILRPTMIHGPGNKGNLNLLHSLIQKGVPYPLGAINNKRSFVSIENLCFIINEILKSEVESGLYHIADDEPTHTHDLIRMIAELTGKKARIWNISPGLLRAIAKVGNILPIPLNDHRLAKLTGDFIVSNQKIKQAINKPLPVRSDDGLRKTIQSFIQ